MVAAQAVELVTGQPEAAEDLVVVLPERGRGESVMTSRSGGDPKRPPGITVMAGHGVLEILVEPAGVQAGQLIHPLRPRHLLGRDVVFPKGGNDIGSRLS